MVFQLLIYIHDTDNSVELRLSNNKAKTMNPSYPCNRKTRIYNENWFIFVKFVSFVIKIHFSLNDTIYYIYKSVKGFFCAINL